MQLFAGVIRDSLRQEIEAPSFSRQELLLQEPASDDPASNSAMEANGALSRLTRGINQSIGRVGEAVRSGMSRTFDGSPIEDGFKDEASVHGGSLSARSTTSLGSKSLTRSRSMIASNRAGATVSSKLRAMPHMLPSRSALCSRRVTATSAPYYRYEKLVIKNPQVLSMASSHQSKEQLAASKAFLPRYVIHPRDGR